MEEECKKRQDKAKNPLSRHKEDVEDIDESYAGNKNNQMRARE